MAVQIVFEVISGEPVPRSCRDINGQERAPDGDRWLSVEQAHEQFKVPAAELRRRWIESLSYTTTSEDLAVALGEGWQEELEDAGACALEDPDGAVVLPDDLEQLRRSAYPQVTRAEMLYLVAWCEKRGLDVWGRDVFPTFDYDGRRRRMIPSPTIEAFRKVAHRTGLYAGNKLTTFEVDDAGKLVAATAYAYRLIGGKRRLFESRVEWAERYDAAPPDAASHAMPKTMLGKCAEGAVTRLAFPEACSGFYLREELEGGKGNGRGPSGGRAPGRPRTPACPQPKPTPPPVEGMSRQDCHLTLHGFGIKHEADRARVIREFTERWPTLIVNNETLFYGRVAHEVGSDLAKYVPAGAKATSGATAG